MEFLEKNIYRIKDLQKFLNQFDENKKVVIQMFDGEYDRIGFIDAYSESHTNFTKEYYLPKKHHDALILACYGSSISSQY